MHLPASCVVESKFKMQLWSLCISVLPFFSVLTTAWITWTTNQVAKVVAVTLSSHLSGTVPVEKCPATHIPFWLSWVRAFLYLFLSLSLSFRPLFLMYVLFCTLTFYFTFYFILCMTKKAFPFLLFFSFPSKTDSKIHAGYVTLSLYPSTIVRWEVLHVPDPPFWEERFFRILLQQAIENSAVSSTVSSTVRLQLEVIFKLAVQSKSPIRNGLCRVHLIKVTKGWMLLMGTGELSNPSMVQPRREYNEYVHSHTHKLYCMWERKKKTSMAHSTGGKSLLWPYS